MIFALGWWSHKLLTKAPYFHILLTIKSLLTINAVAHMQ